MSRTRSRGCKSNTAPSQTAGRIRCAPKAALGCTETCARAFWLQKPQSAAAGCSVRLRINESYRRAAVQNNSAEVADCGLVKRARPLTRRDCRTCECLKAPRAHLPPNKLSLTTAYCAIKTCTRLAAVAPKG